MSDIALYNLLKRIPDATDAEIKEAVADIASSKGIATKSDITELKAEIADVKAEIAELRGRMLGIQWALGLIFVMNVAILTILAKLFF